MAHCKTSTLLVFLTALVAALAADCPQDPLACLQSVMSKNQARKAEETNHLREDVPGEGDVRTASFNEATPHVRSELKEMNETFCAPASAEVIASNATSNGTASEEDASTEEPATSTQKPCKKCTVCPKRAIEARTCNATHDTVCLCDRGDFFNALSYECKPCSPCPHGWGVWRVCTRNRNTVCRKCPPGTYSGVLSGSMGCVLCSSCRPDQVMLQECSRIQDTVCIDKSIGQKKHFLGSGDSARVAHADYYAGSSALPIYFTVLVVIICGLVAYVLLQCRLKRITKSAPLTPGGYLAKPCKVVRACPAANYTPLAQSGHLYRQASERAKPHAAHPHHSLLQQQAPMEHRPTVGAPLKGYATPRDVYRFPTITSLASRATVTTAISSTRSSRTGKQRYCDITSTKKRALEASINPLRGDTRDWKGLAHELGFEAERITKFEELGKEKYGPSRHMLTEWSKKETSTVSDLVAALFRIGRIDAAYIVDASCLRTHSHLTTGLMV